MSENLAAGESRLAELKQLPMPVEDPRKAARKLKKQKKKLLKKQMMANEREIEADNNGRNESKARELNQVHGSHKGTGRVAPNEAELDSCNKGKPDHSRDKKSGPRLAESPQRNGKVSNSRKSSHHSKAKDDDSDSKHRHEALDKISKKLEPAGPRKNGKDSMNVRITEDTSFSDYKGRSTQASNRGGRDSQWPVSNSRGQTESRGPNRLFHDAQEKFERDRFVRELESVEQTGSSSHANHSTRYVPIDGERVLLADEERIRQRLKSIVDPSDESSLPASDQEEDDHVGKPNEGTIDDDKCLSRKVLQHP